jgi:hypothetical protein
MQRSARLPSRHHLALGDPVQAADGGAALEAAGAPPRPPGAPEQEKGPSRSKAVRASGSASLWCWAKVSACSIGPIASFGVAGEDRVSPRAAS